MATRKEAYKMVKVTMNLREGDKELLGALHPKLGYQKVIRQLVIGHIERVKGKLDQPIVAPEIQEPA